MLHMTAISSIYAAMFPRIQGNAASIGMDMMTFTAVPQALKHSLETCSTWHEVTPDEKKGHTEAQPLHSILASIREFQTEYPQLLSSGDW